MKRFLPFLALFGLTGFALAQNASTPAQEPSTPQDQQQQQQPQSDTANSQQSARNFEGKIEKSGDKLVLEDSTTGTAYQLDDQDKAKQFKGKNVKVIATMDPNTNTLHVVDISPAENR